MNKNEPYEQLVERFVRWAEDCPEIRAAIVVGSRARVDHPADEWSDLDLLIITTDPQHFISATDWVNNVGKPLLEFVEPTGTGDDLELRVLFEGMLDVDFAMVPIQRIQQLQGRIPRELAVQISNTFSRGMRILLDKDHLTTRLQTLLESNGKPSPNLPTRSEFLQVVNDFLYHAVFTAKHLRRGELWWTVTCLNCYMQRLLLKMIEWYAMTTRSKGYDTWFRGRFLEEWTEPWITERLSSTFAHYDCDDIKRALLNVLSLFQKMAIETAEKLDYPYPAKSNKQLTEWIETCLAKKTDTTETISNSF
jgi:aminoglycoside 6-adenylyltransferase